MSSRLRESVSVGTTTLTSMYWSPPARPLPRNRSRLPVDEPGGTFTVRRSPSGVGTSMRVPSTASDTVSGASRMTSLPSRRNHGCGSIFN